MKKINIIAVTLISALFIGCNNDKINTEQEIKPIVNDKETINLTVSMPKDDDSARISLEEGTGQINLFWQVGDQVQICVVRNGVKTKQIATAKNISVDRKTAQFSFYVPKGTGNIDIYGVYGGGGLKDSDPTIAVLPENPWETQGLMSNIQSRKDVMIKFASKNLVPGTNNNDFSVMFSHIGFLVCVRIINNSGTAWNFPGNVKLVAENGTTKWINNAATTGKAEYDLTTDLFTSEQSGPSLKINGTASTIADKGEVKLYAWYVPKNANSTPKLRLELYDSNNTPKYKTDNRKMERVLTVGKRYTITTVWTGHELLFGGVFIDSRDNNMYTYVKIGNQTWMAQNLKFLDNQEGISPTGSLGGRRQYVYGYQGTSIPEAKTTQNYKTYGVMYNWGLVMYGGFMSNNNPSGVQGVCPNGWHLPSNQEWTQMENYLVNNGYKYDGTTGVPYNLSKAMSSKSLWTASTVAGSPGNTDYPDYANLSGFSAIPGGLVTTDPFTYKNLGTEATWWTTSKISGISAYAFTNFITNTATIINNQQRTYVAYGCYVRCVKN